ncbi:uncharacterized protein [Argopecten irradians]|uniref:uncharacterized protein n=1 Tax=Argopecten irradians TaxID=31199 RepID=UPI00371FADC9
MMDRMMKSLMKKSEGPNGLSELTPILTQVMLGLTAGNNKLPPTSHNNGVLKKPQQTIESTLRHTQPISTSFDSGKEQIKSTKLTAQSSIADIMAHLTEMPNLGTPTSTHENNDQEKPVDRTMDSPIPDTSSSLSSTRLKTAVDLLRTAMTTLTAASDIINKLVLDGVDLDIARDAISSGIPRGNALGHPGTPDIGEISIKTMKGKDEYRKGALQGDHRGSRRTIGMSTARSEGRSTSGSTRSERRSTSGSTTSENDVDNRNLTPFESVFGEIVPVPERGQLLNPIGNMHLREKDFVRSGKNSLQPNSNDKDIFSHPMDFPHQAEPYPHLAGKRKSPGIMPPPMAPPMDMTAFPGSMMSQFESPVPPQNSMPMGGPNQSFNPGNFGSRPTLNTGFMPPTNPDFMSG